MGFLVFVPEDGSHGAVLVGVSLLWMITPPDTLLIYSGTRVEGKMT